MPHDIREKRTKARFMLEDGHCPFCKQAMTLSPRQLNTITIDHVVAKARGGTNQASNIQIMCAKCNFTKSSFSMDVFVKCRLWEMPKANLAIFKKQDHASRTGNIKCIESMKFYCDGSCLT